MRSSLLDNYPWLTTYFRPIAVIIMIMCINVALVDLVALINPAWSGHTYFLIGMFLVTLEGLYAQKGMEERYFSQPVLLIRYRFAEWVIILLTLRLLALADQTLLEIQTEMMQWWHEPVTFLTFEYSMMIFLAFAAWMISTEVTDNFDKLHDPHEHHFTQNDLTARFFTGGLILVIVTGFTLFVTRWGDNSFQEIPSSSINDNVFNVLLYFMVGLLLLSQINLTKQLMRWEHQGMIISPTLVSKWVKYSLLFLSGLTLFVFFLPTHYTFGFLSTAGFVVAFLFNVFRFIAQLLLFIVTLPLLILFAWLEGDALPNYASTLSKMKPLVESTNSAPYPPWVELLQSVLFWGMIITLVLYLIKIYLHDNEDLAQQLKQLKLVQLLQTVLKRVWQFLVAFFRQSVALLPTRSEFGHFRFGFGKGSSQAGGVQKGQSPRDHIRYYYLTLLQQLDEHGLRRREAQTPYEYEPKLQQAIPTIEQEAHDLTQMFVHARYSQGDFSPAEAEKAKAHAAHIKASLEEQQRQTQESEPE